MKLLLEEGVVLPEIEDFGKIALIKGDQRVNYKELIEHTSSFASLVDILPGERVIICSENRPEWVYAFYGTWQRGGIVVPIDYMSSMGRPTEPSLGLWGGLKETMGEVSVRP